MENKTELLQKLAWTKQQAIFYQRWKKKSKAIYDVFRKGFPIY